MVVSCGLDKFLRVHHLHNRKLLHKVGLSCSWQILCFSSDEKCTVYFGGLQFAICGLFYVCREVFLRIKNFSFLVCIYSFIFFGNWACETPIVRGFWFTLLTIEKSSVYVSLFCLSASRTMVCLLSLTCNKIFSPGGVSGLPYLQSSRKFIFVSWCLVRHLLSLYFKILLICSLFCKFWHESLLLLRVQSSDHCRRVYT